MSFIEFHKGCGDTIGCFGPREDFVTIFGTETWHLYSHFFISLLVSLVLFSTLLLLKKKGKVSISSAIIVIIPIIVLVLLFFVFAYFFPVEVSY